MGDRRGPYAVVLLLIAGLMCVSVSRAQNAPSSTEASKPPQTLKVDVDLVLVNATVTTSKNVFVTGLQKDNFQLWEDNVEQNIAYFSSEDVPMSIGLVVDVSGSMKDKMATTRNAYTTFLKNGTPEDEYFVEEFSDRPQMAADFTTDVTKLQGRLMFTQAKGQTAMYDAVYVALDKLKSGSNPKKALLLITDGEDNRSRYTFSNVREFVKEQDVQIYSIGIVGDYSSQLGAGRTGRALIEELSDITGGKAFFPDSVYDLEDICDKIGTELKNQYVIGYHSTNQAKDGKWRKLRVKAKVDNARESLTVRAKTGYYGSSSEVASTGGKK